MEITGNSGTTWLSCHTVLGYSFPFLPHTNLCCASLTDTPHPVMQPSFTSYSHLVPHSLFQTLTSLTTHLWKTAAQRSLQNENWRLFETTDGFRCLRKTEWDLFHLPAREHSHLFVTELHNMTLFSFLSLQNSYTTLWELWVWGLMTARPTSTKISKLPLICDPIFRSHYSHDLNGYNHKVVLWI